MKGKGKDRVDDNGQGYDSGLFPLANSLLVLPDANRPTGLPTNFLPTPDTSKAGSYDSSVKSRENLSHIWELEMKKMQSAGSAGGSSVAGSAESAGLKNANEKVE